MPFNELKRQDSFPPTILHLSPSNTNKPLPPAPTEHDIDANPISFFLTTPTPEEDDYDYDDDSVDYFSDAFDEEYSAGIEGSEEDLRSREVREVSPSSLQREKEAGLVDEIEDVEVDNTPLLSRDMVEEAEDEVFFGFAMPLSLKDFTARPIVSSSSKPRDIINTGRTSRTSRYSHSSSPPMLRGLGIDIPEFKPKPKAVSHSKPVSSSVHDRGRGRVKLSPTPSYSTPRRTVSLSPKPRKPVSWRVPSRGIWRIDEVEEDLSLDMAVLSSSAPGLESGFAGILRGGDVRREKKGKKSVRWADEQLEERHGAEVKKAVRWADISEGGW